MNIAVFGWYHHQNAGDDRMQQCITRWLDGHCLAFLPAGRPPPLALLRTYDAAILGGGSIVNPDGGMFRDISRWVRKVGIPVGIVSVTLDEVRPTFRAEFRRFLDLDLCCFAWFRDQESADLVGPHPKVFAAPDITWLFPFGGGNQTLDHGPQTMDHGQSPKRSAGGECSDAAPSLPAAAAFVPGSDVPSTDAPVQGPRSTVQSPCPPSSALSLQPSAFSLQPSPRPFPIAVCLRKQRGLPVERWRKVLAELAAQGHELLPWPLYFENGGDADVLAEVLGNGARGEGQRARGEGRKAEVGDDELPGTGERSTAPACASPVHDSRFIIHNSPGSSAVSARGEELPASNIQRSAFSLQPSAFATEFTLDPVRRAGAVISGRFHGILFALQMGRPVIAVSSLPKTLRFLAENGLDQWCVGEDTPEKLLEFWPQFLEQLPALTQRALETASRLRTQAAEPAAHAKAAWLAAAGRLPPPNRRLRNRVCDVLDLSRWL